MVKIGDIKSTESLAPVITPEKTKTELTEPSLKPQRTDVDAEGLAQNIENIIAKTNAGLTTAEEPGIAAQSAAYLKTLPAAEQTKLQQASIAIADTAAQIIATAPQADAAAQVQQQVQVKLEQTLGKSTQNLKATKAVLAGAMTVSESKLGTLALHVQNTTKAKSDRRSEHSQLLALQAVHAKTTAATNPSIPFTYTEYTRNTEGHITGSTEKTISLPHPSKDPEKKWDNLKKQFDTDKNNFGESLDDFNLQLQDRMQDYQQLQSILAAILETMHKTGQAIIGNMK